MMKTIFCVGFSCIFIAVAGIEGGGFTLAQGAAVGIIGGVASLATMRSTGWFE